MGVAAAAGVTYAWTKMTFIGDPEYDLDLSAAASAAAAGDYTMSDLFSGEMGTKFLVLTAVGATTGLTAPYTKILGSAATMAAGVSFGAYRAIKKSRQKKADAKKKASGPDTVKNPNPRGRKKMISKQSAVRWVSKNKGNKAAQKYVKSLTEAPRVPRKKGQHRGSKSHSDLYTDENPKGTIKGLKFATVADAKASVSKINGSGKPHAHKIQAAVAMEQRAKEMGKASQAAVYRAFINKMKKKTKAKNETKLFTSDWWTQELDLNPQGKELLLMGGAAGHMSHPFDDNRLTFGDFKNIINMSLEGKLSREDNVTEKLDGQNLMISYVDGELRLSLIHI